MPGLDPDNQDSAYLCGRLLATLEAVQYAAVGDVGATIIDRFYGRASTSPALVFGQLMSLAQSHLGGIDNAGAKRNLERDLEEVMAGLTAFPKTLFIEDQGSFALGYWHQRAKRFEDLRQRRNARQSAEAESQPGTESEGELL